MVQGAVEEGAVVDVGIETVELVLQAARDLDAAEAVAVVATVLLRH